MKKWIVFCGMMLSIVTIGLAQGRDISPIYEAKMRFWKPTKINTQLLPENLRVVDMPVEGEYESAGAFSGGHWKVQKVGKGRYAVVFEFGNCTTSFAFKRIARYENGALILRKPVIDSSDGNSPPYNRLYTVKFQGKDYLLPDKDVILLDKNNPASKPIGFPRLLNKNL